MIVKGLYSKSSFALYLYANKFKDMWKTIIFLLSVVSIVSCELIDYHPYDGRLNHDTETDINKKNILQLHTSCHDKDTIRFAFIGDTQRALDETNDFVNHLNQNDSVDFIIHGGDISDFGMKKEFEWAHDILSKLKQPYVALIGNHDVIGNGDKVFRKMYGDDNFSFVAGETKFICLNTNAIEYDYSHPVPDFSFIKGELADTLRHTQTVVVMHAPPGSEQFDNNVEDVFQIYIKMFPSLQFCLHAHTHNFSEEDKFNDGIIYYGCDNIAKRSYLLFTVTKGNYTYEIIRF